MNQPAHLPDPTPATHSAHLLAPTLRQTLQGLGVFAGGIYLIHPQEPTLVLSMLAGWPQEFLQPWERVSLSAPSPISDTLRSTEPLWVANARECARRYPRTAVSIPYEFALAAVPISTDTTDYGVLFALWPGSRPARLPHRDHDHLRSCADHLAQQLHNAPEPVWPPPRPHHLPPSTPEPDPATAMAARLPEGLCALDLTGRLTTINPAGSALVDAPAEQLIGVPPWQVLPWLNNPAYEDRYRAALITQRPTSFTALRPPWHWLTFHLYPDPTGITVRISPAPTPRPTPADPTPKPPAPPTPPRIGTIYHVVQLATTLTEAVGAQDVMTLIADQIMPAFGGAALALLNTERHRLRVIGSRGYPPQSIRALDGAPLTAHLPNPDELLSGVPGFYQTAKELEQAAPNPHPPLRGTMASWAFLPLIAANRTVGVCVLAFDRPHIFRTEERTVLNSLGVLIAQALHRAHQYDSTNELARGLQAGLLPRALPPIQGLDAAARYLPGTEGMEIGGDFYDLIPLGPNTVAAVIGDIQGHNVTAAALMGQARTAVRAYATTSEGNPGQVLERVNRLLSELDTGLFASCTYLHLDLHNHQASIARAGHPPPLLRHPDGTTQTLDIPGGILLGIEPDAHYPHLRIPLPPDSVLALYTDGLVEKPGTDIDDALTALAARLKLFGDQSLEGLADILSRPAHLAEQRDDDVALLLLRPTRTTPRAAGHPTT